MQTHLVKSFEFLGYGLARTGQRIIMDYDHIIVLLLLQDIHQLARFLKLPSSSTSSVSRSSIFFPKCFSISCKTPKEFWSTKLMAIPDLPNLPVLPIRWRYVSQSARPSMSTGKSKLITMVTCSTSIPLASTLVVMSTFSLPEMEQQRDKYIY